MSSVEALGLGCVAVGPGSGAAPNSAPDVTVAELIGSAFSAVGTPWVLVLVAGETVLVPDPALLLAALDGRAGPVAPWVFPADPLLPDPLHLGGARLVRVDDGAPAGPWAVGEPLYVAESAAPYLIESRRSPFGVGSAAARWGLAVAGRRMRDRGESELTAADGLLDAALLAWSSEPQGALSAVSRLLGEVSLTPAEKAVAARIQFGAALADGRQSDAGDALAAWAEAEPADSSVAAWRLLLRELDQELTDPAGTAESGVGLVGALGEGWFAHCLAGFSAARWTKAAFEIDIYLGYLDSWAKAAAIPSLALGRLVCEQLVNRWRRMGRSGADLVARWPVPLTDLLVDFLEVGDTSDQPFWLAVGLACTEKRAPTEGMLVRAEAMIVYMTMSDALLWTLRAKEAGHADHSMLRRRAASNLFPPRDRVLAAALALQHAGDAAADPILQAAARECAPSDFPAALADLASLASAAIPVFVTGASTTEDRAQVMVAALRDAGIVRDPDSGEVSSANRAQRRAERRRH